MITSIVTYLGNLRTEAEHLSSSSKFITDAPLDNHGKGEAFSPTDLLSTSLANCMFTIMGIVANNHGINLTGMRAEVTKIMGTNPRRVVEIQLAISIPCKLDAKERQLIENAARTCPVAKSLHPDLIQSVEFFYP